MGRAPGSGDSRGCGSPLLFGCGCLLLVLGIASVAFTFKAKDILNWWFTQEEKALLEALPADVTLGERQRLQSAFADLRRVLESGTPDAAAMTAMQSEIGSALSRAAQGTLTREDVQRVTEAIEAAVRPPASEPDPELDGPARQPARRPGRQAGWAGRAELAVSWALVSRAGSCLSTESVEAPAGQGASTQAYRGSVEEKERSPAGCIGARMAANFPHGALA